MENNQKKFGDIPSYIKWNDEVNNPRFIPDGMNEVERNIKRIGDFLMAGVSLVVFSPLFLVCYIAVKKEDGGPAIFKQERIGRFGRSVLDRSESSILIRLLSTIQDTSSCIRFDQASLPMPPYIMAILIPWRRC